MNRRRRAASDVGQLHRKGGLSYRNVVIFRDQQLGHGSFGAVYKATCDELPCAIKLLHPTLAGNVERGQNVVLQKFEQECILMDSIRHPNIVLYLGMYPDPDSGLPGLLMELLDESLTKMLETSPGSLPYFVQVDISHDVSLALSHLHSLNILHRDLSSNNVLITAKRKAKVTDFGVSRYIDLECHSSTPLSLCPGTKNYMPPEALNEPGVYSEKLDVFSLGVVIVQLITRLFPNPTSSTEEVHDERYPEQRLQRIVCEVDRRKNHIDLVDPTSPLRGTALDCLRDEPHLRPTATELCRILARFKWSEEYLESKRNDHMFDTPMGGRSWSNGVGRSDIDELKKKLYEKEKQISEMRYSLSQNEDSKAHMKEMQKKDEELAKHTRTVKLLQQGNDMLVAELRTKTNELQHKTMETMTLQDQLSKLWQEKQELITARDDMFRQNETNARVIGDCKREIREKDAQIQQLHKKLDESGRVSADFQSTVQDLQSSLQYPSLSSPTNTSQSLPSPLGPRKKHNSLEKLTVDWRSTTGAPYSVCRGNSAVYMGTVYFACKSKVCEYKTTSQCWRELPDCPQANGGFVTINEFPTMIGGERNGRVTNILFSLVGNTQECNWIETFPKMPTSRVYSSAIVCSNHVIAAGGSSSTKLGRDVVTTVEVMEIGEFECMWFSVSNLCIPLADASLVAHQGDLMLIGGTDCFGITTTNLKCSIGELLDTKTNSNHNSAPSRSYGRLSSSSIWRQLAESKLQHSTGVVMKDYLLAVGGTDNAHGKNTCTTLMYRYNDMSGEWEKVGLMKMARSLCFAVCLPGNELMVFGGYTGNPSTLTNTADIATIV